MHKNKKYYTDLCARKLEIKLQIMSTINNILNCECGKTPTYKEGREPDGHYTLTNWYILCECGLRTKSFTEGYDGSKEDCQIKSIDIWNQNKL